MDCRVIKDLLPVYVEQLTSEPSNDLIRDHIATCEDCSRTLAELQNSLTIANPPKEKSPTDTVPLQLIRRIKKNILEKTIILASIALAAGILIGLLSTSPVMFMAFLATASIIPFAAAILLSIAVCRKASTHTKSRMVANWTILFSLIVSCLLFVLLRGVIFNEFAPIAVILIAVIIYNIVFSATLRIYARKRSPKDADDVESTNRRLYIVAFCTLLALTLLVALPATILETNRIIDNLDLPFENDPNLLGKWRSVDFVESPEHFVPGRRAWNGSLFLEEMIFLGAGKMTMIIDNPEGRRNAGSPIPWLSWTKGVVLNRGGDHTASKYILKELEGKRYLFFEWKSGDTIYFHLPPKYYVLERED